MRQCRCESPRPRRPNARLPGEQDGPTSSDEGHRADEPLFIIYGFATAAFGMLLTVIAGGASLLRPPPPGDAEAAVHARPTISWSAPGAPTWKVERCGLLHGASPGDLVIVGVEAEAVIVARRFDDGVQRLATYPVGVRLRPAEGDAYLLTYGSSDIALLTPVDADPALLIAALLAATG